MLVDDDVEMLRLLQRIVRSAAPDYTVLACDRGDVALERATQQPTPLVITDFHLPGMNGLQLTAALKARAPATRIVLITAMIGPDVARRAQDRGVDHFVIKPFQVDSLIQIVHSALA
jgi:CheY-like chemotaxis protein